jgi:hypothetical protein
MFESMDWQQCAALGIVAASAAGLIGGKFRRRKFGQGISHCGCDRNSSGSGQSIVFRARKGARPEILIKMSQPPLRGAQM